jgi:PAS domain S-box-containing protein
MVRARGGTPMARVRILVVSDEKKRVGVLRSTLLELGYEVPTAVASVSEAADNLDTVRPDLILMDIRPRRKLDGIDDANIVRNQFHIPVIRLANRADEPNLRYNQKMERHGYLIKPFHNKELKTAIEMALHEGNVNQGPARHEETYRELIQHVGFGVAVFHVQGKAFILDDINEAELKIHGMAKEDVIGKNLAVLFPDAKSSGFLDILGKVYRTGKLERIRLSKYNECLINPKREYDIYKLNTGEVVAVNTDPTDEKDAHRLLKLKDDLIALSPIAMAMVTPEGHLTYVNRSFLRLWEYKDEKDVLGKPAGDFWRTSRGMFQKTRLKGHDGVCWEEEVPATKRDGSLFDARISVAVISDRDRNPIGLMVSFVDVTEQKTAEKALKESEQKYRSLFNRIVDSVVIFDKQSYKFLDCNAAFLNTYGYSEDELKSMTPFDLHPKNELEKVRKTIDVRNVDQSFVYTHITKHGQRMEVDIRSDEIEYQGHPAWISIIRDITERRQIKEEVRLAHAKLDGIFNMVSDGIRVVDKKFNVLRVNETLLNLLKMKENEIIGKKCYSVLRNSLCHSLECPLFKLHGKTDHIECKIIQYLPDNMSFPSIMTARPFRDKDGQLIGIIESIKSLNDQNH